MTRVCFVSADGLRVQQVDGPRGKRLLDVAWDAGQPLEGTCEGQMACSTCHVIVDAEHFAKLPPAADEEEDMLDLTPHVTRYSRLACQIWMDDALDALSVRIPGGSDGR